MLYIDIIKIGHPFGNEGRDAESRQSSLPLPGKCAARFLPAGWGGQNILLVFNR